MPLLLVEVVNVEIRLRKNLQSADLELEGSLNNPKTGDLLCFSTYFPTYALSFTNHKREKS